jgi:hypothetical protein
VIKNKYALCYQSWFRLKLTIKCKVHKIWILCEQFDFQKLCNKYFENVICRHFTQQHIVGKTVGECSFVIPKYRWENNKGKIVLVFD